jgi:DNA repair exonuclease SbcCD ATPase subunit
MKIVLKKVHIQNFKNIKDMAIDFTDRTTVKGQNGLGKTTVADAVMWVLFNKNSEGSQADKIRPHDVNGKDIDFIDIVVSLDMEVDGKPINIVKTQKQKWVKKGKPDQRFDGNVNTYEINTIPKSERDFRKYFDNFITEEVFRFCSNANAFMALKPKDRRSKLFELVANVTDLDVVNTSKELEPLKVLLTNYTVEELLSRNAKALKEYNKQLDEIPCRIDEVEKTKVVVDVAEQELLKTYYEEEIKNLEEQEEDLSKVYDQVKEKQDELLKAKLELSAVKQEVNRNVIDSKRETEHNIVTLKNVLTRGKNDLDSVTKEIDRCKFNIAALSERKADLLEKYKAENAVQFDSSSLVCSYCGQEYPEDKKEKIQEDFFTTKAKKVNAIVEDGKKTAERIREYEENEKQLLVKAETFKKNIAEIEKSIKSESIKLSSLPTESELLDKNDQYNSLSEKIKTLEKELETTDTGAELRQQLRIKKLGFKEQLRECESVLAKSSANDIAEERIEELKAKQVELAQSIATFEKEKYLLDQFTKTKISILTDEINKNFKLVQWKLFETQINGGYKEICEPTVNGTPYNYGLNAGHKILSELDIINTLQKINDVQVPVFLDNAERLSDNNIPTTDCQLIVLKVSDDTKLVVEHE